MSQRTKSVHGGSALGSGEDAANGQAQPNAEELDEFREVVASWIHLDEQVKKLQVAIRERKMAMNVLTPKIQNFMMKYKYDDLQTQAGKIRSSVREVSVPIKIKDVKEKLIAAGDKGEELVKTIFDAERPKVERRALRRIEPKVSLNLSI